jgi:hypothetical protein
LSIFCIPIAIKAVILVAFLCSASALVIFEAGAWLIDTRHAHAHCFIGPRFVNRILILWKKIYWDGGWRARLSPHEALSFRAAAPFTVRCITA